MSSPPISAETKQTASSASDMAHTDSILDIAASFIRALNYSPPPFELDPTLKEAAFRELQSWDIGEVPNGVTKYIDLGLAAAEVRSISQRPYELH